MERKLEDVGHRVETGPGYGLISDITHAAPSRGEVAKGRIALQAARKQAAAAVGARIQDRRAQAIAYARREPEAALTAAAAFGFLVGFALAMGSRGGKAKAGLSTPAPSSHPVSTAHAFLEACGMSGGGA
jgi:hypothetical protein